MIVGEPLYLVLLLPLALAANLLPGGTPRALALLVCSYAYYCTFSVAHLSILLAVTIIAFTGGLLIERFTDSRLKIWTAGGAIAACLSPLLVYKYLLPAFSASSHAAANWQLTAAQLTIPIGLSFYTFAFVGYLADVALGIIPAERRPLRTALFGGFFPIVTSGPIPRTHTVLPQLDFTRNFTSERGMLAVTEILTGAIMKLWIADTLGATSAAAFSDIGHAPPLEQFLATILFAFQLYADFAGYSLIAIGSARLFGVDIPPNFRQPFLADSIAEFWRRWHISLLSWVRDYVYMPLYASWRRHRSLASAAAAFLSLVLVGIWHGAGWGFVLFGAVHGILVVYGMTLAKRDLIWSRLKVPASIVRLIRVPITFLVVTLTLILIRARDVGEAVEIYRSIFSFRMVENVMDVFRASLDPSLAFQHIIPAQHGLDFLLVAALVAGDALARSKRFDFFLLPAAARAAYYAICLLIVLYQATSAIAPKPFVYFQF
jgi:alginate O-acetyltransferase complex protein AlgI